MMKRLNITLPESVAEAIAAYENKSKFISEAIVEKIKREAKEKMDALLIKGYKEERKQDGRINKEWEEATLEGWPD